jgi:DNA-nicking Smr family endonuclease
MRRKKKIIPADADLYASFGVTPADSPGFGEELEDNLARQDMTAILQEKAGPQPPPPSARAKLRSYPPPQDELDLHGATGAEADRATSSFISQAATRKLRTVRLITGKGLHSEGPAVLPDVVESRLLALKADQLIRDFAWDKKEKHRSGAVLVYLP